MQSDLKNLLRQFARTVKLMEDLPSGGGRANALEQYVQREFMCETESLFTQMLASVCSGPDEAEDILMRSALEGLCDQVLELMERYRQA